MSEMAEDGIQTVITVNGVSCRPNDRACAKRQMQELQRYLRERREALQDMRRPMARVATYLDRWVQENFRTEGDKVGGWRPLKAGGRHGPGGFDPTAKILQDTGRLRASFKPFAHATNAGIGTDLPYAKKHEEGEDGLPKRRMLMRRGEVLEDARKILNQFVREEINK